MTTTVHVEIDEIVKAKAEAALADSGLGLSEVLRLMLILIASGKASPIDLLAVAKKEGALIPNAETIEAIEAARRGELSGPFNSVDELMTHLHADD
jgi:DNA-damage-inducible protein J